MSADFSAYRLRNGITITAERALAPGSYTIKCNWQGALEAHGDYSEASNEGFEIAEALSNSNIKTVSSVGLPYIDGRKKPLFAAIDIQLHAKNWDDAAFARACSDAVQHRFSKQLAPEKPPFMQGMLF